MIMAAECTTPRIAIIGGGLGGLALAQGLKKNGIHADVFERDRERHERLQGYRIHLSPEGSRALVECLSPEMYELFLSTIGRPNRCLSFFDEHLDNLLTLDGKEIGLDASDPVNSYKSVSRISFRETLMTGLDEELHFDRQFTGYTRNDDGTIDLAFADGTRATCDILIGADGTRSRVRSQLLPDNEPIDTGATVVAGKVPLTTETRSLLPWQFFEGGSLIFAPGELSGFAAVHEFSHDTSSATPKTTDDYIMWNVIGTTAALGTYDELSSLASIELQEHVLDKTHGWSPRFAELVKLTDLTTITPLTLRTAVRPAPWHDEHVTLLGDAIHAMPPTAGVGAVSAVIDAARLTEQLVQLDQESKGPAEALGDYQSEMLDRTFKKVNESNRNLRQAINGNRAALTMSKIVFRTIARIGPARRSMTRSVNA